MQDSNFKNDVSDALEPVLARGKFSCTIADERLVQFEAEGIALGISYDADRSFEVGVEFGQTVNGDLEGRVPFNLGEVYRFFGVPDVEDRWFCQSANYEKVVAFLRRTAATLVEHCLPLLKGETSVFDGLRLQRRREGAADMARMNLETVKPRALTAWQERRYADFVRLMKPFEGALSVAERRQLSYAERKQQ